MLTIPLDDERSTEVAVTALMAGEVIVLPTDTVYGLAAVPRDPAAVDRIFQAKGRPAQMHLPILASSLEQVRDLGVEFSGAASALAERWWPGPLTLVFGFSSRAARPAWLHGREEVAVRIPGHPYLLGLMARTGVLTVTSANPHGATTPPSADEVAHLLAPHVTLIIDGGILATTPSTVVNVRSADIVVEREGAIAHDAIIETLATVQ